MKTYVEVRTKGRLSGILVARFGPVKQTRIEEALLVIETRYPADDVFVRTSEVDLPVRPWNLKTGPKPIVDKRRVYRPYGEGGYTATAGDPRGASSAGLPSLGRRRR